MAETGTNLISSINKSGSGIDLAELTDGLVKAETDSKQKSITKKMILKQPCGKEIRLNE